MHYRARLSAVHRVVGVAVVAAALSLPDGVCDDASAAQAPSTGAVTLCDQPIPPPATLPPVDSGPVVYALGVCFPTQGNVSVVEPETYLYYIHLRPSRPSQNEWVPYDDVAHEELLADFLRLWGTAFLDDLRIEADDYVFANGVMGKVITYYLEERERIKIVQYDGSTVLDRTKIDEALRDKGISLKLDSFLDQGALTRASRVLRDMMAEKGFTDATVSHTVTPLPGGPKLVNVTFHIGTGPKTTIRDVEFVGNRAVPDATLARLVTRNRAQGLLSFVSGGGAYRADQFAEDAQSVEDYYHNHGFISARVGEPELRPLDDSADGRTRWIQLRIPITEGTPHRLGSLTFEGNKVAKGDVLQALFKVQRGEWYDQEKLREGLEKARELYGAAGYMEFTGVPDLQPQANGAADPVVDVLIRINEGDQYIVNRLTFAGNTTTRDSVIRREFQLAEGGVFNTEALKYSIRRLNQLGYFKPLEGSAKDLTVDKSSDRGHAVDVTVTVEEQNRNQVQFGAGVSQYEGVFGNISFTTSNFMGRGESLTLAAQRGSRSSNYEVGITEPYLLSRPISGGVNLFSRKTDYLTGTGTIGYSEVRSGASLTGGYPLFRFARTFLSYSYEVIDTAASSSLLDGLDASASVGVPVFNGYLDEGRHTESRITPSFVHNTVNSPFNPRSGTKISLSLPVAGGVLGGTTNYIKPEFETVLYIPHTRRTAFGFRATGGMVRGVGATDALPYYVRYFLGGENQIRGVDIRTVGPTDKQNRAIGGDRFVLFNAEYYFDIAGPVRALLFHDAGQAFAERERFDLRHLRTSSGAELRVMMPVVNVPFRFIYAWNIYRDTFQPARTFKFAVGSTF